MEHLTFDCGCRFPKVGDSIKLDITKVNFKCQRTWDLLSKGLTKGVFQLESQLGQTWTKRLKPENMENLIALGSILRPGCLHSKDANNISMTEHYCRRKNFEEPVEYFHPALEAILNKTYGVLIFQEQAIEIVKQLANFSLQEADELRKATGKKIPEEMSKVEIKFLTKAHEAKIVTDTEAKQIFDWIKESQRYSFNRSHAACYAITGYYCAYCKAHFPVQMYNSWLDHTKDKQEVRDLINEAKLLDIQVLPPNIINLKPRFHNDGNIITFGLTNIQKVGDSIIKKLDKLVREQESIAHKKFKDWTWLELLARIGPIKQEVGRIGQSALASMISVGALRHFHPNRTLLLAELDKWAELSSGEAHFIANNLNKFTSLIEAMRAAAKLKKEGGGCHSIERQKTVNSLISLLENPPTKLEDSVNWIAGTEEILLGIAVTCSRVDGCDLSAVNTTCKDFHDGNIKVGSIIMGVELEDIQELKTKTGKTPGAKMARLTISDGTCSINAICWPESYKNLSNLLVKGNTLIVQGYKDRKQGGFIISQAYQADLLDSGEN
jgi:DNA polymerase III alpha subunit